MAEYAGIEKRRSPRVEDGIKIRIFDKNIRTPAPVINISRHGALVRARNLPHLGEVLDCSLYLPTQTEPIDLKGRVARIVTTCSAWGFRRFNIGIEFLNLVLAQKEKLSRTVDCLLEKT